MDVQADTILLRKKKTVKFSYEELVLALRAYLSHPSKWGDLISEMKENIHQLNQQTRELYESCTTKQIRDRISAKLSALMAKPIQGIDNEQIRTLVGQIRTMERRLVDRPQADAANVIDQQIQAPVQNADDNQPLRPAANDQRDQAVAALPPSSDEDQAANEQDVVAARRKRKRPLAELVRENHTLYNRFMRRKLPKIMRELGISSDDNESD